MWRFVSNQWFMLMLACVLAIGFLIPGPLVDIANSNWLRNSIVASVLFLMALPLRTSTVVQTIRRPAAALISSIINMGVLPLVAWGMSLGLSGDLAIGFVVMAAVPCTLASAAVWTRRAGGNDAIAIMVTLLTNSTCFLLTPLWILVTTEQTATLNLTEMANKLVLLVVLPMALGQLARLSPTVAKVATRRKQLLSTLAQLGMLSMILIGAVHASQSLAAATWDAAFPVLSFLILIVFAIVLHLTILAFGMNVARALRFERADSIAIAVAGSQKSLMVGLYVTINFFGGLVLMPLIVYHVVQLSIDTIVADVWRRNQQPRSLSSRGEGQDERAQLS